MSEELLFRGVLLVMAAVYFLPLIGAIIISNIVFGLLHMRTALYALDRRRCRRLSQSLSIIATGNLLAPITTHILYDAVALEYTRRAIADAQRAGVL